MQAESKIVELRAENVKRIKAVAIRPDGDVVVLSGKNSQGKSSVLDSIWYALGGGDATKQVGRIIRDGETEATAEVELSNGLKVRRRWWYTKGGDLTSKLEVMSPDGAKYPSPQVMLDKMLGALSFDPLAFSRMKPADQVKMLLEAIGAGESMAEIDRERKRLFDERTDQNRRVKDLAATVASIVVPDDAPDAETSPADIMAELDAARELEEGRRSLEDKRGIAFLVWKDAESSIDKIDAQIAQLTAERCELEDQLTAARRDASMLDESIAKWPAIPDVSEIRGRLVEVDERNRAARAKAERAATEKRLAEAMARAAELTTAIEQQDERKVQIVKAASLPVDGVGFDDDGVTFGGVKLHDCSASERLRVSIGVAMALNPGIRVLRIEDGALLDAESMTVVADMAKEAGFQVWIETVDRDGDGVLVIEDGQVRA